MAVVKTMNGTQLLVQIGDGATPTEAFVADCLINTQRGISFSAETNEFIIPDCDNPDDPAWKEVTKDGLSATISGAGMLHTASVETMFQWFTSKNTKNVRVRINVSGANGGGYWAGAFHCTEFEVTGERNAKADCSITLVSNGPITWTDAV
jgi:predicted secreted protein